MKLDHRRAPLFEALERHAKLQSSSFHVPGHKSGQGTPQGAEHYYRNILAIDLTELPGLDDLHQPEEAINEAQLLAADGFGADETFFLVGGSTAGNIACIMAVCDPGDLLIVQRDVHKSVLHGIMLAGARAVFIQPRMDEERGLSLGLTLDHVEQALRRYPEAKGVLLTNPSYYGLGIPLQAMADLVHSFVLPLIVDEAHGAHYGYHELLPASAIASGADAAVQSSHKMLAAMTMGAMLHLKGDRINASKIRSVLTMLQSSSPSYPILASLDLCRREAVLRGGQRIEQALSMLVSLKENVNRISPFRVASVHDDGAIQDPFKLALFAEDGSISGFELAAQLKEHGCYTELADLRHVLLAFSLHSAEADANRLIAGLHAIKSGSSKVQKERSRSKKYDYIPTAVEPISNPVALRPVHLQARDKPRMLRLSEAAGHPSADMLTPYPPGIPIVYPGETLTPSILQHLKKLKEQGARIHGLRDPNLHTLAVIDES